MTDPHPAVQPFGFLIGTWRGAGRGDYPTIAPFEYTEEVTFGHVGKPFLTYHQRTWDTDGAPLHTETGYVRPVDGGKCELVIAQPTGVTEIHDGTIDGHQLRFVTRGVGLSATAKDVRSVARTVSVADDTLAYRLDMAAVGQGLAFHLEAELRRT